MTRVQILLTVDEDRRLERLAKASRESKSSVVRRAVNLLFRLESQGDEEPLLRLVGQAGRARAGDAARDHDRLLVEADCHTGAVDPAPDLRRHGCLACRPGEQRRLAWRRGPDPPPPRVGADVSRHDESRRRRDVYAASNGLRACRGGPRPRSAAGDGTSGAHCRDSRPRGSSVSHAPAIRRPELQLRRRDQLRRDAHGRIRHAFAFDQHFAAAGFVRIPVDLPLDQL